MKHLSIFFRISVVAVIFTFFQLASANNADAFSITSGSGTGCHESITLKSAEKVLELVDAHQVVVPDNKVTREFMNEIMAGSESLKNDPQSAYIVASLLVGVRVPDTMGDSTSNRLGMAVLHNGKTTQNQHCLRKENDDWEDGNIPAMEDCKAYIEEMFDNALMYADQYPEDQTISVPIYLEYYGKTSIEVNGTAYYLGIASHALQDSFAHTIRSKDMTRITHVMNYVDALQHHFDEKQDGLAHSSSLDDCNGDAAPLAEVAALATSELFIALEKTAKEDEAYAINDLFDRWMVIEPGCTIENNYCNTTWTKVARTRQTSPVDLGIGCNLTDTDNSMIMNMSLISVIFGVLYYRHYEAARTKKEEELEV